MSDGMPVEMGPGEMFILLGQKTLRLQLPPLALAGLPETLSVHLDLDAAAVDDVLERLTVLRAQMLPAPVRN
jgi:hypothetical protein